MSIAEQVFVVGAPRSGTTFLAGLLGHTRYGVPFETHFVTKYYKRISEYGDINLLPNFQKLLTDILSERAVMQWKLSIEPESFFKEFKGNVTYPGLVNKICLLQDKEKKSIYWGDKTPHYMLDLELIYSLFPKGKYLYIVRDGRDVALSLLQKEWGPNNIYACARHWCNINHGRPIIQELQHKGLLLQLSYEGLLDNTEQVIREVYDFLDENIEEEVIQKLALTTKRDNYFKWKKVMSPHQKEVFEQVAGSVLNKYGYEVQGNTGQMGTLAEIFYKLHDKLIWFRFMFKTNVIDGIRIKYFGKEPFAD